MTETPARVTEEDLDQLREAGWDEEGIYPASALISFFSYSGRMESVSAPPAEHVKFPGIRLPNGWPLQPSDFYSPLKRRKL